jgi:nucleoid DNA-binding protein
MTQSQVMEHLVKTVGISKKDAIRLAGLGIFRKRKRAARLGRNPATGEQIKIPARTRLRFTPAKALKEPVLGAAAAVAKKKPPAKPKTVGAAKAVKRR